MIGLNLEVMIFKYCSKILLKYEHFNNKWIVGIQTAVISFICALYDRRTLTHSAWSPCAAMWRAVRPFFVLEETDAPRRHSILTTASCPFRDAQCSGVKQSYISNKGNQSKLYWYLPMSKTFRILIIANQMRACQKDGDICAQLCIGEQQWRTTIMCVTYRFNIWTIK